MRSKHKKQSDLPKRMHAVQERWRTCTCGWRRWPRHCKQLQIQAIRYFLWLIVTCFKNALEKGLYDSLGANFSTRGGAARDCKN